MNRKIIRIACLGAPSDYRTSLLPLIIQGLGYKIEWTTPIRADVVIYSSFYDLNAPRLRWLPRSWRKTVGAYFTALERGLAKRRIPPMTLFHTAENLRHDHIQADYSVSHDLNIQSSRHFRLPYWMEMIDWSHEGVVGNSNPRYGGLLSLKRLREPLGDQFLKRSQKAVLISSHMREPRATCYAALKALMPVEGMGSYFDDSIQNHHKSNFLKKDILINYAYNLCPENGIYPGYVTEKIPEAFAAGCLPITMVDPSVEIDFNPHAFLNLYPNSAKLSLNYFSENEEVLQAFADEPLIREEKNIFPLVSFLKSLVADATN